MAAIEARSIVVNTILYQWQSELYNEAKRTKQHYGEIFKKSQYDKDMTKKKREKAEAVRNATKQEALMYLMFAICGLFILLVFNGTTDYDTDLLSQRRNAEKLKASNED